MTRIKGLVQSIWRNDREFKWDNTRKFQEACHLKYYLGESSTLSPYFHTKIPYKLFWGEFIDKSMQDSLWISWSYLESFPYIQSLVEMFRHMGFMKVMALKHNWNESVVHQFYATLDVDMEGESFVWMIGKEQLTLRSRNLHGSFVLTMMR